MPLGPSVRPYAGFGDIEDEDRRLNHMQNRAPSKLPSAAWQSWANGGAQLCLQQSSEEESESRLVPFPFEKHADEVKSASEGHLAQAQCYLLARTLVILGSVVVLAAERPARMAAAYMYEVVGYTTALRQPCSCCLD